MGHHACQQRYVFMSKSILAHARSRALLAGIANHNQLSSLAEVQSSGRCFVFAKGLFVTCFPVIINFTSCALPT